MGLPRRVPRLDHGPREPSPCRGGGCLPSQGGGWHSQVVGPGAANRPCLSWHSHQGRIQGPFSVGSWGWGPSKNKTRAGPAGG